MDASALSELIKTKVASLIQEHLKPVVSELAAQQQILQTHSALLRYNHNVNDYQMGRLENLRDLEQSIKCVSARRISSMPLADLASPQLQSRGRAGLRPLAAPDHGDQPSRTHSRRPQVNTALHAREQDTRRAGS